MRSSSRTPTPLVCVHVEEAVRVVAGDDEAAVRGERDAVGDRVRELRDNRDNGVSNGDETRRKALEDVNGTVSVDSKPVREMEWW